MAVRSLQNILDTLENKSPEAVSLITRAYEFAKKVHEGQERYSGDPYFAHPAEVAYLIAEIGMGPRTTAAGLLHDTLEDASVSPEDIQKEFGDEVYRLVDGVTKLGTLRYRGLERHTEALRKLFAATAHDIRVLIVKLMDRLHNAKTLEHVPKQKSKRIALETLEVYAPIADRLGMGIIKRELEDAAFPFAYPSDYRKVQDVLKERSSETQKRLQKAEKTLKKAFAQAGIREFRTESRVKGVYSLFRKLERKEWDISKIHDILALRIILPSMADCYTVLGIVHGQWRPVPGKIKDFIASPKLNGYQSIHTTIYTGDGGTLEIQIRSEAMHSEARFGIASHLSYKEAGGYTPHARKGSGLAWIRQFLPGLGATATRAGAHTDTQSYKPADIPRWIKELAEMYEGETVETDLGDIKSDFFSYRVFTFTPRGDVIDLPVNATPIDFAYAIHSDIGNHIFGAKVNGKLVSLDTPLHNGDIVEILTKASSSPTQKWHAMAKTALAKKHIRAALQGKSF
jgi:GTP pyrophosphokinase